MEWFGIIPLKCIKALIFYQTIHDIIIMNSSFNSVVVIVIIACFRFNSQKKFVTIESFSGSLWSFVTLAHLTNRRRHLWQCLMVTQFQADSHIHFKCSALSFHLNGNKFTSGALCCMNDIQNYRVLFWFCVELLLLWCLHCHRHSRQGCWSMSPSHSVSPPPSFLKFWFGFNVRARVLRICA